MAACRMARILVICPCCSIARIQLARCQARPHLPLKVLGRRKSLRCQDKGKRMAERRGRAPIIAGPDLRTRNVDEDVNEGGACSRPIASAQNRSSEPAATQFRPGKNAQPPTKKSRRRRRLFRL